MRFVRRWPSQWTAEQALALTVGIDLATAAVRAVALDAGGTVLSQHQSPLPEPRNPRPGWSEQDALSWWPSLTRTLRQVTAELGDAAAGIRAVSIASTSGTVVALDEGGGPIGPALTYADQRAVSQAALAQSAAADRWQHLGVSVQPSFGLPKMAWLAAHAPGIDRLAHASDLLVSKLIGTTAPTDWSHALKSGYDPLRGEWALEALEALNIDPKLLPEVLPPTALAGPVCEQAAEVTGLPAGCQVRLGMTDSCASQLAAGAGSPGKFVSVLGSTLVLKGATDELVHDPTGAVYSHRHPQGWWLPGGASSTGGRYLTTNFPGSDLAALDNRAEAHGPARALVYPLPGRGERFPFVAPGAETFVIGHIEDTVEHYRAALEGVAFVERMGYERLAALGIDIRPPIVATGRGSAGPIWSRIRATVLGMPLMVVEDASTARGAAILAAAGSLHPDLAAATKEMSATGRLIEPNYREKEALDESYDRFRKACSAWLS